MQEIVPNPQRYIDEMRRVTVDWEFAQRTYEWKASDKFADEELWNKLGVWFHRHKQVLIVTSTRRSAHRIYDLLPTTDRYHLSRRMCSAHLRKIFRVVEDRLATGKPVRLVATNLIEAGSDLDFKWVYRMWGGFDNLVQAAGRANREGLLGRLGGTLRPFFCPMEPPPGILRCAADIALSMITAADWSLDLWDVTVQKQYFHELYQTNDNDHYDVRDAEEGFQFVDVDWRNKWIKNTHMIDVVVPYDKTGRRLVTALINGDELSYKDIKLIQRYIVALYPQDRDKLEGFLLPGYKRMVGDDQLDDDDEPRLFCLPQEAAQVIYDDQLGILVPDELFDDVQYTRTANQRR